MSRANHRSVRGFSTLDLGFQGVINGQTYSYICLILSVFGTVSDDMTVRLPQGRVGDTLTDVIRDQRRVHLEDNLANPSYMDPTDVLFTELCLYLRIRVRAYKIHETTSELVPFADTNINTGNYTNDYPCVSILLNGGHFTRMLGKYSQSDRVQERIRVAARVSEPRATVVDDMLARQMHRDDVVQQRQEERDALTAWHMQAEETQMRLIRMTCMTCMIYARAEAAQEAKRRQQQEEADAREAKRQQEDEDARAASRMQAEEDKRRRQEYEDARIAASLAG